MYAVQTISKVTGSVTVGESQSDRNLCELWAEAFNKEYADLLEEKLAIAASEGMSHNQNRHDCKYLGSHPAIETWVGIGDIDYWCENENVIDVPKTLENEMMDVYPDWCKRFEAFEAISASEVKG